MMQNQTQTTVRPARPSRRIEPTRIVPTVRMIAPLQTTAKKRVAAYARVSTEQESQESSYELQVQHYTDFITQHEDWTMVKVFADEGKTGTSTKSRTEFRQMIADCEAGRIDMILTKSISRFARNTVDCLETVRKLKNLPHPVGVYFEKENLDSLDGKSELILTILSSLAQDESRSISENIRWSLQKLYEQGYAHCPTNRLLGYDTVVDPVTGEKQMVIEPIGAAVVKMIFEEFLRGAGYAEIAHLMEQLGALTGVGSNKWSSVTVRRILANEKYAGDVITQKRFTKDFLTHKRSLNEGQMPRYISEDHHDAIIDRHSWLAAQELIRAGVGAERGVKSNVTGSAPHKSVKTVFSSKLCCGNCKAPLIRRSMASHAGHTPGSRVYLWKCRNAEGRGSQSCHAKAIPEIVLEQTFMEMLSTLAAKPRDELEAEFRLANGVSMTEAADGAETEHLKLELDSVNAQLKTMSPAPDLYADMLEELNNRKAELEAQLGSTPDWSGVNPLKKAAFDWFLEQLDTIPAYDFSKTTIPFRADIYERCIERGEVREVMENGKMIDIAIRYTFTFGLDATAYGNNRSTPTARKLAERMDGGPAEKAVGA